MPQSESMRSRLLATAMRLSACCLKPTGGSRRSVEKSDGSNQQPRFPPRGSRPATLWHRPCRSSALLQAAQSYGYSRCSRCTCLSPGPLEIATGDDCHCGCPSAISTIKVLASMCMDVLSSATPCMTLT
ncbi:hypothetical protein OH76DRAFT_1190498 [Lentinus brumalis]|uniref:Uncharacterized protein n=1 Tax=Lentinus brumalis TaxID=2498619 RepID=A0A371CTG8_9APHY|nr:hypothetical protein OH76DRAFT_1190498 [Polyporus brumalis]